MARFTKAHYEQMAEFITDLVALTDADREKVARQMAAMFAATQPSFNRARFLEAAGFKLVTPAIAAQQEVVASRQHLNETEPSFLRWNAWDNAARKHLAMIEGRWASNEEVRWINQQNGTDKIAPAGATVTVE